MCLLPLDSTPYAQADLRTQKAKPPSSFSSNTLNTAWILSSCGRTSKCCKAREGPLNREVAGCMLYSAHGSTHPHLMKMAGWSFFAMVWLGLVFCKGVDRSFLVFERSNCCKLQHSRNVSKAAKYSFRWSWNILNAANYSICWSWNVSNSVNYGICWSWNALNAINYTVSAGFGIFQMLYM